MKKLFIIAVIPFFTGCAVMDQLYDGTKKKADLDSEAVIESEKEAKSEQMTIKPEVRSAINFAGDVAPFPWAGLAASGILNVLAAYGSLRGRKWKKAAVASVAAGNEFRKVVKQMKPDTYQEIKERIIGSQNADGTRSFIKSTLNKLT